MGNDAVEFFGQPMPEDWADMLRRSQEETHYSDASGSYPRVPYGAETFRDPSEAREQPCRHCQTIYGKLHEPACDFEECPKCRWQAMSCDCEFRGHEWKEE